MMMMLGKMEEFSWRWLPEQASTFAWHIDAAFNFIFWVSVFFGLLIFGLLTAFVLKYRDRPGHAEVATAVHNTPIEVTWSVIPFILVLIMFFVGYIGYLDMATPPKNTYDINVVAYKWGWEFNYPNGAVTNVLYIPKDQPIRLILQSRDVIHSLFVPAFRAKKDCVPGRFTEMWFEANQEGTFQLYCTEYCGTRHSTMLADVEVMDKEAFAIKIDDVADVTRGVPPAVAGAILYELRGCNACHSLDGTRLIGPSFKDLYGAPNHRVLVDGQPQVVEVNAEYIRESILLPNVKIVEGYPRGQMPSYQGSLKEKEMYALVVWLQSISSHYSGPELPTAMPGEEGGPTLEEAGLAP